MGGLSRLGRQLAETLDRLFEERPCGSKGRTTSGLYSKEQTIGRERGETLSG